MAGSLLTRFERMLTHFITCETMNDLLYKLKLKSRIGTPGKQSTREAAIHPPHLSIPGGFLKVSLRE